jgi:hypothetical protein
MNFIKYVFGSKEEDDIINNYKTKKVKNILYINNELKSNYINQIIYILLLHYNRDNDNIITDVLKLDNINFTDIELFLINKKIDMVKLHNIVKKWAKSVPFTYDFIVFINIYYIFIDQFEYISKLILIDNILEIFHFIRSIFYRSYYDYYNEIDNINYKLLKKLQFEIEGYIKHKDILNKEIINKKYKIFKIIEMKLENKINYTYDDINKLQNNSILFKKYINTFF